MLQDVAILFGALLVILAAAELFTNGIEWLGHKLNLSEGVVGSVLAAVGTALPETLIPIVAVMSGTGGEFHDIGIGAIAGAPFMLTTLTMSVCGIAIMIFTMSKRRDGDLKLNKVVLARDLTFFYPGLHNCIARHTAHRYAHRQTNNRRRAALYLRLLFETDIRP